MLKMGLRDLFSVLDVSPAQGSPASGSEERISHSSYDSLDTSDDISPRRPFITDDSSKELSGIDDISKELSDAENKAFTRGENAIRLLRSLCEEDSKRSICAIEQALDALARFSTDYTSPKEVAGLKALLRNVHVRISLAFKRVTPAEQEFVRVQNKDKPKPPRVRSVKSRDDQQSRRSRDSVRRDARAAKNRR
jgi:hypothetical protein